MPIFIDYRTMGIDGELRVARSDKTVEATSLAGTPTRAASIDMPDVLVTSWQSGATDAARPEVHADSFTWGVSQPGDPAAAAIDWILEIDGIKGESEVVDARDVSFGDLLPADDGDAAAAIGSADWRNYRVSVESLE